MIEVMAKDVVKPESVPDFGKPVENVEKKEAEESMSYMEKAAIRERTEGMTDKQKRVTLMYMPAEMLFEELERRDMVAKGVLADLREKLHDIRSNMTLDEMNDLIMEVREIARKGGNDYGS